MQKNDAVNNSRVNNNPVNNSLLTTIVLTGTVVNAKKSQGVQIRPAQFKSLMRILILKKKLMQQLEIVLPVSLGSFYPDYIKALK